MVVDDSPDFLELVRQLLESRYDVLALPSGAGLMEQVHRFQPDAVVLDICMPGKDGISLCYDLREDPKYGEIPVLFLTASQRDGDYIRHLFAGGTRYLSKPIEPQQLLDAVEQLFR